MEPSWQPLSKSEKEWFLIGVTFGTLITLFAMSFLFTHHPWAALVPVAFGLVGIGSILTRPEKPD
jgi:hypothetical protein